MKVLPARTNEQTKHGSGVHCVRQHACQCLPQGWSRQTLHRPDEARGYHGRLRRFGLHEQGTVRPHRPSGEGWQVRQHCQLNQVVTDKQWGRMIPSLSLFYEYKTIY